MANLEKFPGVAEHLDDSLPNVAVKELGGGQLFVEQSGPDGGLQSLFKRREDGSYELLRSDEVIDLSNELATRAPTAKYVPSPAEDYEAVATTMVAQVGKLSSKEFEYGQNVACVWAVRTLVHMALGRWITRVDGTAQFYRELAAGFGQASFAEADLPDGAIIISPSQVRAGKTRHGHVGLLGARIHGGDRKIYSNSSALGVWKDHWTLQRWYPHYQTALGLEVLFYPLPTPE